MKELLDSYRIAETDPERKLPLDDLLPYTDMRIRHVCKDMPESAIVYRSTQEYEDGKEHWSIRRKGHQLKFGLEIETCPYCGADLAHGGGDIVLEEFADPGEVHSAGGKFGNIYKIWLEENEPDVYKTLEEKGRLLFECLKVEREAHRYALRAEEKLKSSREYTSDWLKNVHQNYEIAAEADEITIHDVVCVHRDYENGGK